MAQMMTIDGDVLAGLPIVRAFQRKQASQLTFSIEQVAQVISGIIRTNDRIADHGAGNRAKQRSPCFGQDTPPDQCLNRQQTEHPGREKRSAGLLVYWNREDDTKASVAMPT